MKIGNLRNLPKKEVVKFISVAIEGHIDCFNLFCMLRKLCNSVHFVSFLVSDILGILLVDLITVF